MNKRIIGASVGGCVHVGGIIHFLDCAKNEGFDTRFLGPSISLYYLKQEIENYKPYYVAIGYRLTADNMVKLMPDLRKLDDSLKHKALWLFGGTKPVADAVREENFFHAIFDGMEDLDDCIYFLRTGVHSSKKQQQDHAQNLTDRIKQKHPYPLLRHHFGLPSFEESYKGIEKIAKAGVLDIISLGIDQNTQQFYFHPKDRKDYMHGSGGVPVSCEKEFAMLKAASLHGNYPLMRCYSGTSDVIEFAKVLQKQIDNAWCAVPLCWYNEVDGRGTRKLEDSIRDAQQMLLWHGCKDIPVEINEPHHWGLRDAHDTISVAMSYISAYNAKKYRVKEYISQYMFNIPNSLSFSMDLAKVLAQIELTESLASEDFVVYRQTRTGLPFLNSDIDVAKGQLAASTVLSMAVRPHIIHVVGFTEALKAADADVVIESCKIVRGVIRSVLNGAPDLTADPKVQQRKQELLEEASYLLDFIRFKYKNESEDPLSDAAVITDCVKKGILDAPHILKNDEFTGVLSTRMHEGRCLAYDEVSNSFLTERERLLNLTGMEL